MILCYFKHNEIEMDENHLDEGTFTIDYRVYKIYRSFTATHKRICLHDSL